MKISILTLFPEMFTGPFEASIVKRAIEKKQISIEYINLRTFSTDRYKSVDDHPYGGGQGMILRVDIIDRALQKVKSLKSKVILLDPRGTTYKQQMAQRLSTFDHLILVCGHYEGVDERVRSMVDEEISIGNYVLTGGEIPAMVLVDSVVRLLPGVLSNKTTVDESYSKYPSYHEYPQYTKPREYHGMNVPSVLVSGDHKKIEDWKKQKST